MKTLLPILAALLLTSCASASASTATPAPTETPASTAAPLTLEQKVGQLFIVRPDALDLTLSQETIDDPRADGVTQVTDAMRETLQQYPVGGICQFGKNIESPSQLARFNKDLQAASATPLFITVDEEGGMVARLANNDAFDLPRYASAAAVGASGDPENARLGVVLALGLLKVHIELTRDHAVVDLAATGGLFAEVLFKICVRRDGVQPLCRVGLPDLAQRFGKACGLTGVAQALAVGRVRQDGGTVEGAEVLDIGGFKAAAVPHARQLCVGVGQGHGSGVDIVADALKSSILADLGEGFLSLFGPDISGDKVEMFGGKAAAQAGGQIQRFLDCCAPHQ